MKKSLLFSVVLVICALLVMFFGFDPASQGTPKDAGPMVLMVSNDTGAFLLQLRQGAQQAATEAGSTLSLEIVTPKTLQSAAAKWAGRGTEAALLLLAEGELLQQAQAELQAQHVPAVVIQGQGESTPGIAADERQSGELLGGFAKDYDLIYLVGDAPQRRQGALDALTQKTVIADGSLPLPGDNACVLALTEAETLRLADLKAQGKLSAPIAGVDPGEERVALMEQGWVAALVCQSPYAMGYAAVNAALSHREGVTLVPWRLVLSDEMYAAENVKLMFPLLN
jgi:ABC-type sugar transport system substrate-binding protein